MNNIRCREVVRYSSKVVFYQYSVENYHSVTKNYTTAYEHQKKLKKLQLCKNSSPWCTSASIKNHILCSPLHRMLMSVSKTSLLIPNEESWQWDHYDMPSTFVHKTAKVKCWDVSFVILFAPDQCSKFFSSDGTLLIN